MKKLLNQILRELLIENGFRHVGKERLYGLVDMGYIPLAKQDQAEIINSLVEILPFHWERIKNVTAIPQYNNGGMFDERIFFRTFNQEDRDMLKKDIHIVTQDHCSYPGPGIGFSSIGPSVSKILQGLGEDVSIRQLVAYVFVWHKRTKESYELFIIPIDEHIKGSLTNKVELADYSVMKK